MNQLVVVGLNYHSSPLSIRERFIIPESCIGHALNALRRLPNVKEAVVLSTCNRTEVYAAVSDVHSGIKEIEAFFLTARTTIEDHEVLKPNFKLLREDVALHLFRVAAGLDSMVLGEGQILAQVKGAHQIAMKAGTCGPLLDQLFKLALNCGKRVRTETTMGRRAVSVSSAAVELARELIGPLADKNVAVIGLGKMGQICVKHLLAEGGQGRVILLNRSIERVSAFLKNHLPNNHKIESSFLWEDRYQIAASADLVIVATSAPDIVLDAERFAEQKPQKPLCVIDISVPRNVDQRLSDLPAVKLFHADDLACVVNKNLSEREALVSEAENIVFSVLDDYHAWQRSLLVVPTITGLRQKIESIRKEQMEKTQIAGSVLREGNGRAELEEISRAIVNQILHHPTVQLKKTRDYEILRQQAEALRLLFSLELSPSSSRHARSEGQQPPDEDLKLAHSISQFLHPRQGPTG